MSFLKTLALAHRKHEGWFSGSVSQRNNNPGNLRLTKYQMHAYGAVPGERNFARFPTYAVGFRALQDDIRAKITGRSAHIDYSSNPTFLDYIKVYAPAADSNNPKGYTQALIYSLRKSGYYLDTNTPLTVMAQYLEGSYRSPYALSIQMNISRLRRAFARATGALKRRIGKRLARLRK